MAAVSSASNPAAANRQNWLRLRVRTLRANPVTLLTDTVYNRALVQNFVEPPLQPPEENEEPSVESLLVSTILTWVV